MERKIKVAFVLRFMLHYRIDLLERINSYEDTELTLFYGRSIKGSKFINYTGKTNFRNHELKTIQYTRNKKYVVFCPTLFWHLIKLNPDVIIAEGESNMSNNIIVYLYSIFFRKKIVWWGLGLVPGSKESIFQKVYKPFMKKFLRRAEYVIGYSEYAKNYYSQFTDLNKIRIANNCLDNESIDKEIAEFKDEALKLKQSTLYKDKFVILYVGAFIPLKKVDKLIRSYHIAKEKHPDSVLVLVGEGETKEELQEIIHNLKIRDVIFIGKVVEDVSRYFLLANLFVLPGLGGLSIHHAMVHSLPVISASADGTERDLIKDGENGFLLKTDSVEELADRINIFLEDNALTSKFGKKSREIVENRINIRNKVSVFHDVIVNCYNGKPLNIYETANPKF